jgi:hypothetical protein
MGQHSFLASGIEAKDCLDLVYLKHHPTIANEELNITGTVE